jgi:hypothetical protein
MELRATLHTPARIGMSEYEPKPTDLEANEAAEYAASIAAIPIEQLPDDEARGELIRRALAGQDVYAYTPIGHCDFVVWVRQPRPDVETRFVPMDWARLWRAGLQPEFVRKDGDES